MHSAITKYLLAFCVASACTGSGTIFAQEAHTLARTDIQVRTDVVKTKAGLNAPNARNSPAGKARDSGAAAAEESDPDRQTYGMLLAALVLMAAIAIRRHRAGKT